MTSLRQQLLLVIYRAFEQWTQGNALQFACKQGCATCCTQNVTMTAVEGDVIHRHIKDTERHAWFAERMQRAKKQQAALETTNEFAEKCLAGQEGVGGHEGEEREACPYLEDNCCQIYPVRPFSCRSFASLTPCQAGAAAEQPQYYISATTAAQQLIEHIGQGQYWGNMHDVLLALCDLRENEQTAEMLANDSLVAQARARLRKAKALPGFLISAEDYDKVSPFIEAVFNEKIGEKTVEDILNGN